jgi:hypothetical protein
MATSKDIYMAANLLMKLHGAGAGAKITPSARECSAR